MRHPQASHRRPSSATLGLRCRSRSRSSVEPAPTLTAAPALLASVPWKADVPDSARTSAPPPKSMLAGEHRRAARAGPCRRPIRTGRRPHDRVARQRQAIVASAELGRADDRSGGHVEHVIAAAEQQIAGDRRAGLSVRRAGWTVTPLVLALKVDRHRACRRASRHSDAERPSSATRSRCRSCRRSPAAVPSAPLRFAAMVPLFWMALTRRARIDQRLPCAPVVAVPPPAACTVPVTSMVGTLPPRRCEGRRVGRETRRADRCRRRSCRRNGYRMAKAADTEVRCPATPV